MLYSFVGCPKMDFCDLTKIHFWATNKIIEHSYFYCTLVLSAKKSLSEILPPVLSGGKSLEKGITSPICSNFANYDD